MADLAYQLQIHELAGIPVFDAKGRFTHTDVWELVGEKSRVATFTFALGSESASRLGPTVVGVPLYSPTERAAKAASCGPNLRIEAVMRDIPRDVKRDLDRLGLPIGDIVGIAFAPLDRPVERHDTGEKKIPNIISIPYKNDPRVNLNLLTQNLLVMKNNDGVELAPFEKEKLIGTILARNDGHIDRQIVEHFGFTAEAVQDSAEIRRHMLEAKARDGKPFTEHETQQLDDLRAIHRIEAITAAVQELLSCKVDGVEDAKVRAALEAVFEAVTKFRPYVLLTGKRQVYWDLRGYAHIALRHIRKMQLGSFAAKTSFPYRANDLETLIEKVLGQVRDEIHGHFAEQPGKVFYRVGRRSVYFHGDYYSFHIDPDGRLTNFHPLAVTSVGAKGQ